MSDDPKIVSLDQRRREDAARQKAELAAAAAKRRTNGAGRDLNRPFGRPVGNGGAAADPRPGGGGIGRLIGTWAAVAVWGGLAAMVALAVWTTVVG